MYIFALLAFLSTIFGGIIALKLRSQMHLILGFTAGILLSVVSFDLLPEISELSTELGFPFRHTMFALIGGFMTFHILEKVFAFHHNHEEHYEHHTHEAVGIVSTLGLIFHSFLDGLGIGLAFQVSQTAGLAVSTAVLAHNFSDGINSISLMLASKNSVKKSILFLTLTAFAPVIGVYSSLLYTPKPEVLLLILGFFSGFLIYLSAADILPEAHSHKSGWVTIFATILGILFFYTAFSLGSHSV